MATERVEMAMSPVVVLKKMGEIAQALAIKTMHERWKSEGWRAAVLDFKGFDKTGTGWFVKDGWVVIQPYPVVVDPVLDQVMAGQVMTLEQKKQRIAEEINAYCDERLGRQPWYQSSDAMVLPHALTSLLPNETQQAELGYPRGFKVLGEHGANLAVDPTVLVVEDGRIRVLSIVRVLDQARALPGGIVPRLDAVKQKCIDELLEECFSGAFFTPDSVTSHCIDTLTPVSCEQIRDETIRLLTSWKEFDMTTIQSLIGEIRLMSTTDLLPSVFIQTMLAHVQSMALSVCAQAQMMAHLRVELYKKLCVVQYQTVSQCLKSKMIMGEQVANLTDPRSTCETGMVTQTVSMLVRPQEMFREFRELGLEEQAAGDDAMHAHFPTLYDFCCGVDYPPFADHAKLVLDAVADQLALGALVLTPEQIEELWAITDYFERQCALSLAEHVLDEKIVTLCKEVKPLIQMLIMPVEAGLRTLNDHHTLFSNKSESSRKRASPGGDEEVVPKSACK